MLLDTELIKKISIGLTILLVVFFIINLILKVVGKNTRFLLPVQFAIRIRIPLFIFLLAVLAKILVIKDIIPLRIQEPTIGVTKILFIISITWSVVTSIRVIKNRIVYNYDINAENNLKARKIYTQFNILERIVIFIIILFAVGVGLMSFESIRNIGISMLTSAGVAGIIVGFSAQKALGTLLAGIQIAFTQPIRLNDVVIVEGEWGTIEEITLTYVVIKIWDKRRLVVPTTYFIEKPFQNWTRDTSDIMGTVFIHTDYRMNIESLRDELTKILNETDLWDQKVNVLQVTNAKEDAIEIRALMSAKDSPTSWDLRVLVREKLIKFIQEKHPESIPRSRVYLEHIKNNFTVN